MHWGNFLNSFILELKCKICWHLKARYKRKYKEQTCMFFLSQCMADNPDNNTFIPSRSSQSLVVFESSVDSGCRFYRLTMSRVNTSVYASAVAILNPFCHNHIKFSQRMCTKQRKSWQNQWCYWNHINNPTMANKTHLRKKQIPESVDS